MSTQLPDQDGRWYWTRDERWLLVGHAGEDDHTDVLFWALTPMALPTLAPVELQMVTHELATRHDFRRWRVPPTHRSDMPGEGSSTTAVLDEIARLTLVGMSDPTLGHGLGFVGRADTFSGWRWSGFNRRLSYLRLAHMRGTWQRPIEPDRALLAVHGSLTALAPPQLSEPASTSEVSALLVMGVVTAGGLDVPFAILCRAEPACVHGDALISMLRQLTIDASAATARDGGRTAPMPLPAFTERAGVIWQSGSWARTLSTELRRRRLQPDPETDTTEGSATTQ